MKCRNDHNSQELGTQKKHTSSKIENKKNERQKQKGATWIKIKKLHMWCHDLSIGLTTKVRAYECVGQKWSPRVTFHAPESVKGCEGMNPHTRKWTPTPKIFWNLNVWNGLHVPFEYFKHELWPEEGPEVKLSINGRESPWFTCLQVMCHISLASSWRGLINSLNLTSIRGLHQTLWASKIIRIPISIILGLPTSESQDKMTFGCKPHG